MSAIITFLSDNYIWFLIVTLILIFAIIGYLVEEKHDDRFTKNVDLEDEIKKTMENNKVAQKSLNDIVANTASVKNEKK